jgi:hypothetical protein
MWDKVLEMLLKVLASPEALAVVFGVLVFLGRALLKDKWEKAERILENAVSAAYLAVSEIAPKTSNTVDDQVAIFLKSFRDYLLANNVKPTPAAEERALAVFKAMKGQ